jgi:hypothetical protein
LQVFFFTHGFGFLVSLTFSRALGTLKLFLLPSWLDRLSLSYTRRVSLK